MKLCIISDIHGNVDALRRVCSGIDAENPDKVVCLGDVVGYGANPNECCDIVKSIAEVTVMGNHDATVCGRMSGDYYYDAVNDVLRWTSGQLTDSNMEWLSGLPFTARLDGMLLSHGSPAAPDEFDYIFTPEQAQYAFESSAGLPPLMFLGHSHLCKVFMSLEGDVLELLSASMMLRDAAKYIISVGSVGQPRDYDPRACFAVLDTGAKSFRFERLEYDFKAAGTRIEEAGLPIEFASRLHLGV
ncbi:MAG: metallophosphoesterase family protein [Myxococcota bacterium]